MLVTDIKDGTISPSIRGGKTRVTASLHQPSERHRFGPDGALYACQMGSRRVVRLPADGSMMVPTTRSTVAITIIRT